MHRLILVPFLFISNFCSSQVISSKDFYTKWQNTKWQTVVDGDTANCYFMTYQTLIAGYSKKMDVFHYTIDSSENELRITVRKVNAKIPAVWMAYN